MGPTMGPITITTMEITTDVGEAAPSRLVSGMLRAERRGGEFRGFIGARPGVARLGMARRGEARQGKVNMEVNNELELATV